MKHSWVSIAVVMTIAVGFAAFVGAEDSEGLSGWADSPAGFLLTDEERQTWESLDSDAERQDFIELFWARRDPNLDTPVNEFKQEHRRLVQYADEKFSTDEQRGALTERGRVLILMGMPHAMENRGPTETVQRMTEMATGTDEVRENAQLWLYQPSQMAEGFNAKGARVLFVFYEDKAMTNKYYLDRSHREAMQGLRMLTRAPEVWLVNPDLDAPPLDVTVPGGQPASDQQLEWLNESGALNAQASLTSAIGVADANHRPLWLQVRLPSDATDVTTVAGRVHNDDGTPLSTFQTAPEVVTTETSDAYQVSLPLEAGSYVVELVAIGEGRPLVVAKLPAEVPAVTPGETAILGPFVTTTVTQRDAVLLGAPFSFGILQIAPLGGRTFNISENLAYFGFVTNPIADKPVLQGRLTLEKDGKRLIQPVSFDLQLAQPPVEGAEGLWIYTGPLNLSGLPSGQYDLGFRLRLPEDDVVHEKTVPLTIVE